MNYPNKIGNKKFINYKNRGMSLECDINETNNYYIAHNIAFIYKKPTPIKATKVCYQKTKKIITEGYFEIPSTTDYNGLYKGKYIDFEAKETTSKTSFPLSNIHNHQIKHIEKVLEHGGIGFLIIRFKTINKTFLLEGNVFINYISNKNIKSIPYSYFEEKGFLIEEKYQPRLDYIKIIDTIIKE